MNIHPPWTKPKWSRDVEVFGLLYGIMPGCWSAYWDERRSGWYRHSMCRVTCVIAWRYRADTPPTEAAEAESDG